LAYHLVRVGLAGWLFLSLPAVREWLEGRMALHMVVQLPLLVLCGVALGVAVAARGGPRLEAWNAGGIPGAILAVLISAYWMLPRALDSALQEPAFEVAKFLSLPLAVGLPLGVSWGRMSVITKGVVLSNALPMFAVVGWLYREAPVRLCNCYLVSDQQVAGSALAGFAIVASLLVVVRAFALVTPPAHHGET
jgi:hypothetical protein